MQIPKVMNERVDQLACVASAVQDNLTRVTMVEGLYSLSIGIVEPKVMQIDGQEPRFDDTLPKQAQAKNEDCWVMLVVNYLMKEIKPEDPVEVRKLRIKVVGYAIINDTLYRRSFSGPYLRCLIQGNMNGL